MTLVKIIAVSRTRRAKIEWMVSWGREMCIGYRRVGCSFKVGPAILPPLHVFTRARSAVWGYGSVG
jgi:hypothetical protein